MTTAEWIARNLATAPPLTAAQTTRIGALFRAASQIPTAAAA